MQLILVRNVKFSAAECNSFNMRKKNVGDLASKKISGGSRAKKQPSRCKVASFGVQGNTHHGAKLQTSGCDSKFFRFQLGISSHHQLPTLHRKAVCLKLHNYTVWVYIYAVLGIIYHPYLLKYNPKLKYILTIGKCEIGNCEADKTAKNTTLWVCKYHLMGIPAMAEKP